METSRETCFYCEGHGRTGGHECPFCKGKGFIEHIVCEKKDDPLWYKLSPYKEPNF